MADPNLLKLIPNNLAGVAEHSVEVALRFALRFGGQRINIPKSLRDSSPLVKALGKEDAQLIVKALGFGIEFTVPKCQRALFYLQKQRIASRLAEGATTNELAEEFGLHEITIRRIRRAIRQQNKPVRVFAHRGGG